MFSYCSISSILVRIVPSNFKKSWFTCTLVCLKASSSRLPLSIRSVVIASRSSSFVSRALFSSTMTSIYSLTYRNLSSISWWFSVILISWSLNCRKRIVYPLFSFYKELTWEMQFFTLPSICLSVSLFFLMTSSAVRILFWRASIPSCMTSLISVVFKNSSF